MGSNKYVLYVKIIVFVAVCSYAATFSQVGWEKFKDWAMARKATKMLSAIQTGYCGEDAKCAAALSSRRDECAVLVTTMRANKAAAEFGAPDRRMAIGCMHKTFMTHSCSTKTDEAKAKSCAERVDKRYDKCFDYTYATDATGIPEGMGANMVGCMYGVMFVQDDNAQGLTVEETSLRKRPKLHIKPIELDHWPNPGEINELKEQLAELGEQRIENFNEAMDALQEMRGGAAMENTANVDVFDKTGNSQLQSAGIGTAPPEPEVPAAAQ